tara:strand:+ start:1071 stop:1553 length:483 start_codon:yes stop_codon:yes gene_type:complete
MAFTGSAMCASFKAELMQCYHLFSTSANPARTLNTTPDTFKFSLYDNTATLTKTTTAYTATGELASGSGYTTGGNTLTISTAPTTDTTSTNNVAYISFSTTSWTSATFTAYGALIYNSSQSNRAVAVLDFGGAKTVTSGTFTVTFPTYSSGTTAAIIQLQ